MYISCCVNEQIELTDACRGATLSDREAKSQYANGQFVSIHTFFPHRHRHEGGLRRRPFLAHHLRGHPSPAKKQTFLAIATLWVLSFTSFDGDRLLQHPAVLSLQSHLQLILILRANQIPLFVLHVDFLLPPPPPTLSCVVLLFVAGGSSAKKDAPAFPSRPSDRLIDIIAQKRRTADPAQDPEKRNAPERGPAPQGCARNHVCQKTLNEAATHLYILLYLLA